MTSCYTPLKDLITLMLTWLSDPADFPQLAEWLWTAQEAADSLEFSPFEQEIVHRLLAMCEEQHRARIARNHREEETKDLPSTEQLDELLGRKQIEQRTPEWYAQMSQVISASELGQLLGPVRQRGKLVMTKLQPPAPRNQPLAVFSDRMTAFDWGIRFEPVVKQIYMYRYGVEIRELGRLHHPVDPRCTASPDGLIYSCPENLRRGRLIEIKCPVTRQIDGTVPKEYYAQMQMQLQVTGLQRCDYVEAVFASPYNQMIQKRGPALYSGWIALIRHSNPLSYQKEFDYVYSPMHANEDWRPDLTGSEDEVVELIPWRLMQWSEQLVLRNESWWTNLQPTIQAFWEDVERAKQGEFVVPESSRPSKKAKIEECKIVFQRMDEQGVTSYDP